MKLVPIFIVLFLFSAYSNNINKRITIAIDIDNLETIPNGIFPEHWHDTKWYSDKCSTLIIYPWKDGMYFINVDGDIQADFNGRINSVRIRKGSIRENSTSSFFMFNYTKNTYCHHKKIEYLRYGKKLYNSKTDEYHLESIEQIAKNECQTSEDVIAFTEIFYQRPIKECMAF